MSVTVRRESLFPCEPDRAWALVQTPRLLRFICFPILDFRPMPGESLGDTYTEGSTLRVRMYLFGFVPLGIHSLEILRMDDRARIIETHEHDRFLRQWDHRINVIETPDGTTRYRDEIEIDAGLLTIPVAMFARFFFRHRQRRWPKALKTL